MCGSLQACEEVFERTRLGSASSRQYQVRLSMLDVRAEHRLDLLAPNPGACLPLRAAPRASDGYAHTPIPLCLCLLFVFARISTVIVTEF